MVIYVKRKRASFFKWILAGLVFVAALTITFNDVYGSMI